MKNAELILRITHADSPRHKYICNKHKKLIDLTIFDYVYWDFCNNFLKSHATHKNLTNKLQYCVDVFPERFLEIL